MSTLNSQIESDIAAANKVGPRYKVVAVTNIIAGPRYVVYDRQAEATVAEFLDLGHFDRAYRRFVVDTRIGLANAEMFCQIMNVAEEASRGQ